MIDLTVPQRQSPLAIVFLGLRVLRSLGIAQVGLLVVFVLQARVNGVLIVVPIVAISAFGAFSAIAWWRYTFQVVDDELVVTKGVIQLDRLNVPIERIQSIAIDQKLLHRLTGLVSVSVDTAGGTDTEFAIDAIPRAVAEELQRKTVTAVATPLRPGAALPPPQGADDEIVFTFGWRRLLLNALTMSPLAGLIVLGPVFALGGDFFERLPDVRPDSAAFRWWWVPIGVCAFLAFSVVLNIVRFFLRDWQLTLFSTTTGLRRTSGLLSRTSTASSVDRIQMVSGVRNPLQRRAGLHGVELSTIGQGDLVLTGCDDEQFATVGTLARVTPFDELRLERRVHPAAVFIAVRNATVMCTVAAISLWFPIGSWSLLAFAAVPVVWFVERIDVANFRWDLRDELASSRRVVSSATRQALLHKTNTVHVTQSLFERRRGLAKIRLATAAGSIEIGMIPVAEAQAARDQILHAVETDSRPWM